jgi:hypothetical protein
MEPACFFIDSVDEAKLSKIHSGTALRKIADAPGLSSVPELRVVSPTSSAFVAGSGAA